MFTKDEKKTMLKLINDAQLHMIMKNSDNYKTEDYIKLEGLKIKINYMDKYEYEDDGK